MSAIDLHITPTAMQAVQQAAMIAASSGQDSALPALALIMVDPAGFIERHRGWVVNVVVDFEAAT